MSGGGESFVLADTVILLLETSLLPYGEEKLLVSYFYVGNRHGSVYRLKHFLVCVWGGTVYPRCLMLSLLK